MTTHSILINKSVSANSPQKNTSYSWKNGEAVTGETPSLNLQFKSNRHAFLVNVFHEDSRNQIRLIGVPATSQASLNCRIIAFFSFFLSAQNSPYLERQRQHTLEKTNTKTTHIRKDNTHYLVNVQQNL
jgi:hypothetical protein